MEKKHKEKLSKALRGSRSPKYKGGSKSTDALNAKRAWEKHWGKQVPKGYVISHKDGNPENNSIGNLSIMSRAAHNRLHKKGKKVKDWGKGMKNKPNIGTQDGKQRRFR